MSRNLDTIRVHVEERGVVKAQRALRHIPGAFQKAVMRAANRASSQGKTRAARIARKMYTVKSKDVREALHLKRATRTELMATLYVRGAPLTLSKFKYGPRRDTTGANRAKVKAEMIIGDKRPVDKGFVFNGFIWARTGDPRHKIRRVSGSSVPRMLGKQHEEVEDVIREAFQKRLEHETQYILRRHTNG